MPGFPSANPDSQFMESQIICSDQYSATQLVIAASSLSSSSLSLSETITAFVGMDEEGRLASSSACVFF